MTHVIARRETRRETHAISRRELLERLAAAGLLIGTPGLLAACGGDDEAGGGETRRRLVVLDPDVAPALGLDGAQVTNAGTNSLIGNLYDTLVDFRRTQAGDTLEPVIEFEGKLAESWEQNGREWTFLLRRGVKSCVGNELTADDVLWTFERAKSVSGQTPLAWVLANIGGILGREVFDEDATPDSLKLSGEVEKVDDYTVTIHQFEDNENLLTVLAIYGLAIFDSTEMKKHATPDDPWAHTWGENEGAAGFGPYCLETWEKSTRVELKANPSYYRGTPHFTSVSQRKVPQSANRISSLLRGEADVVTQLSSQEYASVEESDGVKVLSWFGNLYVALGLNYAVEPWSGGGDPDKARLLRQAVAFAVPYEDIVNTTFLGQARKWNGLISSVFYGAASFEDKYVTNLDQARRLLEEAGHPGGAGISGPGLTMTYTAERQSILEPLATALQTALAEIGIQVQLDPIPAAQYAERRAVKHDMPMFIVDQNISNGFDAGYMCQIFYVSTENGGFNNAGNYVSKRFDDLYFKQKNELGEERLTTLREMQELLMTDLPLVPIAERPVQVAVREDMTGWAPLPQNNPLQGMDYSTFEIA